MVTYMIFSKDIIPMCIYCEHGKKIIATDDIICSKKGIVKPDYCCKKFKYTPLNRIPPKKNLEQQNFTKEDFEF